MRYSGASRCTKLRAMPSSEGVPLCPERLVSSAMCRLHKERMCSAPREDRASAPVKGWQRPHPGCVAVRFRFPRQKRQ